MEPDNCLHKPSFGTKASKELEGSKDIFLFFPMLIPGRTYSTVNIDGKNYEKLTYNV